MFILPIVCVCSVGIKRRLRRGVAELVKELALQEAKGRRV